MSISNGAAFLDSLPLFHAFPDPFLYLNSSFNNHQQNEKQLHQLQGISWPESPEFEGLLVIFSLCFPLYFFSLMGMGKAIIAIFLIKKSTTS